MLKAKCKICHKKFKHYPRSTGKPAIYCSRDCYFSDKEKMLKKGQNPNWIKSVQSAIKKHYDRIGRLTPIKDLVRKNSKYLKWRLEVFKRDNWTCQVCGERGGKLNADHYPKSYSEWLNEIRDKSVGKDLFQSILKYKQLWDITNGRTLCLDCHKKTPNYLRKPKKLSTAFLFQEL